MTTSPIQIRHPSTHYLSTLRDGPARSPSRFTQASVEQASVEQASFDCARYSVTWTWDSKPALKKSVWWHPSLQPFSQSFSYIFQQSNGQGAAVPC